MFQHAIGPTANVGQGFGIAYKIGGVMRSRSAPIRTPSPGDNRRRESMTAIREWGHPEILPDTPSHSAPFSVTRPRANRSRAAANRTAGSAGRRAASSGGSMPCRFVGALIEEVRFAADSPLEGDGFEPSVPRQKDLCKHERDRRRSRARRRRSIGKWRKCRFGAVA